VCGWCVAGGDGAELEEQWRAYFELYGSGACMMITPELKHLVRLGIPSSMRAQRTSYAATPDTHTPLQRGVCSARWCGGAVVRVG
jgi:hypothetical protein